MKKNINKSKITLLVLTIVLMIFGVVALVLGINKRASNEGKEESKSETELIFSFESYKDITGTSIRLANKFGATEINEKEEFITDGKGSWLVKPQGDYGQDDVYPYFQMRCKDTSFKTSDFNAYDKVMMDVYNASEEDVTIKWTFTVLNAMKEYVALEEVEYTLKANEWNTCEYDLSAEVYSYHLHLEDVKYMTVTFLTQKDNKEDSVPELYFDNLRGHFSESERMKGEVEFDLQKGVGFENAEEQYVIIGDSNIYNKVKMTHVAYEDTTLGKQHKYFGKYGLKGDATGTTYPGFTVNFGKKYTKDMVLSFMLYVEVDEKTAGDRTFWLESRNEHTKDYVKNQMLIGDCQFNRWIQVNMQLSIDASKAWIYINLDDNGTGKSILGNDFVNIYMDNFAIYDSIETIRKGAVEDKEDGTIAISNPYNSNEMIYNIDGPFVENSKFSFDIDFNVNEDMAVAVLGNGSWSNDYYYFPYHPWEEKQHIEVILPAEIEYVQIYVLYEAKHGVYTDNVATISNINVQRRDKPNSDFTKGITFENAAEEYLFAGDNSQYNKMSLLRVSYADAPIGKQHSTFGNYGLKGDATGTTWPGFTIDFNGTHKKDTILNFMLYVSADAKLTEGKKYDVESRSKNKTVKNTTLNGPFEFNKWVSVSINLNEATDGLFAFVNLDDKGTGNSILGNSNVSVYMDNFTIYESEDAMRLSCIEKDEHGTIVVTNPFNINYTYYTYEEAVKKGDTVSFDIDVSPAQSMAVWLLGDGEWEDEYYANYFKTWNGKTTIKVKIPEDTDYFTVYVKYRDENRVFLDNVVTISNVKVLKKPANYKLSKGITLEDAAEQYIFMDDQSEYNKMNLSHVAYADTSIGNQDTFFGKNALQGNTSGVAWPGFTTEFEKTYSKGQVLSFMVYVQADEDQVSGKQYYVESYSEKGGKKNKILTGAADFNQWAHVLIELGEDSSTAWSFLNLDDGTGNSIVGDKQVTVFMDNFVIYDSLGDWKNSNVTKDEAGLISISNPYNSIELMYDIAGPVKANSNLKFDLDFNVNEDISIWLLGNGSWGKEIAGWHYTPWEGKQTISVNIEEDLDYVQVYILYQNRDGDYIGNIASISNIVSKSNIIEVTNPNNSVEVMYDIAGPIKAYSKLTFDIDFNVNEAISIWLLGNGSWGKEIAGWHYTPWEGKETITVDIEEDLDYVQVYILFQNRDDEYSDIIGTITNVKIERDVIEVTNPNNSVEVMHDIVGPIKEGSTLTFDIDFNVNEDISIWLLGNGSWKKEIAGWHYTPWEGKETITVDMEENLDYVQVYILFQNRDGEYSDIVASIFNVKIERNVIEVTNPNNSVEVMYDIAGPIKAGNKLTFDIKFNVKEDISIWILGNGSWKKEIAGWHYTPWEGKKTITVDINEDLEYVQVYILFQNRDGEYSDIVAAISNIKIERNVIEVTNPNNSVEVMYNIAGPFKAGSKLTFDIDFNVSENISIWILGNGSWKKEIAGWHFKPWEGKETITVDINEDLDSVQVYILFQNQDGEYSDIKATISDIKKEENIQVLSTTKSDGVVSGLFTRIKKIFGII